MESPSLYKPLATGRHPQCDRGKMMTATALEAGADFSRYLDVDGDSIPYRTYPGTHPTKGFVRSSPAASRDRYARYTEEGAAYADNMQRLLRRIRDRQGDLDASRCRPMPKKPTMYGVIYFGVVVAGNG